VPLRARILQNKNLDFCSLSKEQKALTIKKVVKARTHPRLDTRKQFKARGPPAHLYPVDLINRQFERVYRSKVVVRHFCPSIRDLQRLSLPIICNKPSVFAQFGFYNKSRKLQMRDTPSFYSAFNKCRKLFGTITKEKAFRFLCKVIVVSGITYKDFKSIMKIRDLWYCGKQDAYRKSVRNFTHRFPKLALEFVISLPRKEKSSREKRFTSYVPRPRRNALRAVPSSDRGYQADKRLKAPRIKKPWERTTSESRLEPNGSEESDAADTAASGGGGQAYDLPSRTTPNLDWLAPSDSDDSDKEAWEEFMRTGRRPP